MIEVIDNFLTEKEFSYIQETMLGPYFPWYYNNFIVSEEDESLNFQLIHNFYKLNPNYGYQEICDLLELVQPILSKLNMFLLIRSKANLTTITDKHITSGYHCDFDYDCTTAIFYINSNNGYTIFKDTKEKVKSVPNRLLKFDTRMKHSGVSSTDEKRRVVINFNYIEKEIDNGS